MPIGPLILFGAIAVVIALIFAVMLMPPNRWLEKIDRNKHSGEK